MSHRCPDCGALDAEATRLRAEVERLRGETARWICPTFHDLRERAEAAERRVKELEVERDAARESILGLMAENTDSLLKLSEQVERAAKAERERDEALARVARLEEAICFFLQEFPCYGGGTGIHATVNNKPGRCPEESDDPKEWCMSARFRRAISVSGTSKNTRD